MNELGRPDHQKDFLHPTLYRLAKRTGFLEHCDSASMKLMRVLGDAGIAFILSMSFAFVAAMASGFTPLDSSTFARWDSASYLSIATRGYYIVSCSQLSGWCGNSGWFPGYSLLIRMVAGLGLAPTTAGFIVSNAFFFLVLIVLRLLLDQFTSLEKARWALLTAAVFPGSIYYHAVFPISTVLFFVLLSILLFLHRLVFAAAIATACAGFSYPTGFLSAGTLAFAVLFYGRPAWRWRVGKAALYGAIGLSGFLAVLVMQQAETGRWDAFFLVQTNFGHLIIHNPFETLRHVWSSLRWADFGNQERYALDFETLIMAVVGSIVVVAFIFRLRSACPVEAMAAIHVALFSMFPLVMGGYSPTLTRAAANLLPLVLLTPYLPGVISALLLAVFAFLKFEVAVAFFKGVAI